MTNVERKVSVSRSKILEVCDNSVTTKQMNPLIGALVSPRKEVLRRNLYVHSGLRERK